MKTVQVINVTRDRVLAKQGLVAERLGERMRGLLGQSGLAVDAALWIRPCTSIHSCFMRFRFDAVFVDRQGVVLHLIREMKPWRLSKWVPRADGVLELPAGTVARTDTRRGDRLRFEDQIEMTSKPV